MTQLHYGPSRQRYKRIDTGTQNRTTYYMGAYEKEVRADKTIHRIQLGDFAIVEKVDSNPEQIQYTIRDDLGSLIATVSDTGQIKRLNFDPWGKRLDLPVAESQPIDLLSLQNFVTDRGFTGHEHLDGSGLIHMNGRVYDPVIARFISADPLIQAPGYLQSYNRYSYTWNNPLRYTDPSGFSTEGKSTWEKVKETWESVKTYFRERNQAVSNARRDAMIDKHVYGKGGNLPAGVSVATDQQKAKLGVDGLVYNNERVGFKTELYYDAGLDEFIYAFAGTDSPTDKADMQTNVFNGLSMETVQYNLAMGNAQRLSRSVGAGSLSFTGHSLGGGLASAAATVTGRSATTFNAAGVSSKTIARALNGDTQLAAQLMSSANVDAYYMEEDGLSRFQDSTPFVSEAIGRRTSFIAANPFMPSIFLTRITYFHSIDTVIDAINIQ